MRNHPARDGHSRALSRPTIALLTTILLTGAGGTLAGCQDGAPQVNPPASPDTTADEHEEMVERAEAVMPFDLTTTTHTFTKTDTGGVQDVVAHDPTDTETVALIRSHMEHETESFRDGDFGDPATIHGADMAGLDVLPERADELTILFEEIDAGGRITYAATDPELIEALHSWFDHQDADHSHSGMGG